LDWPWIDPGDSESMQGREEGGKILLETRTE
jgi:hypothetical protein